MEYALNENIKRQRMAQGMTQVQFAKLLGVSKQCVSNWENDNVLPSIEMLVKIAELFCVTTDYLLGRGERAMIDASSLTEEQIGHISLLVRDLSESNGKRKGERG